MVLRVASQSGRGALGGLPTPLAVGGGLERVLTPWLVLLLGGMVGGAFTGILVPLCLHRNLKDCSDCLLARGMASGDVEELLGGSWALSS